jgi:hypothetical protein
MNDQITAIPQHNDAAAVGVNQYPMLYAHRLQIEDVAALANALSHELNITILAWVAIHKQSHTWRPAGVMLTWLNSSDDVGTAEAIKERQHLAGSRMPGQVHIGARPEEWVDSDEFAVVCLLDVKGTVK